MATTLSDARPANGARIRFLTFPREHGAWGILLVPLITGAAIGANRNTNFLSLILLFTAALSLFCLRTPVESSLPSSPVRPQTREEIRAVRNSILGYAAAAAISLFLLIVVEQAYALLLLGGIVGLIFLTQVVLKKMGRETRTRAQLIGSVGLTSTAAAAYYVATGGFDLTALLLWAVNGLFAANQILFVQLRIRAARVATRQEKLARARVFLGSEAVLLLLLIAGWVQGYFPVFIILAFAPIIFRGLLWTLSSRQGPLDVHRLGLSELTHAVVFCLLLVLAFQLPRF